MTERFVISVNRMQRNQSLVAPAGCHQVCGPAWDVPMSGIGPRYPRLEGGGWLPATTFCVFQVRSALVERVPSFSDPSGRQSVWRTPSHAYFRILSPSWDSCDKPVRALGVPTSLYRICFPPKPSNFFLGVNIHLTVIFFYYMISSVIN